MDREMALERDGPAGAAEGRAEGGRVGPGITLQDNDAVGLDRGAAGYGHPGASGVVAAAARSKPAHRTHQPMPTENMTISLTDPFTGWPMRAEKMTF